MTDSDALLKRKYMIVKFLIDREFITFFIQTKAQTHVAQEVPIDGFISGRQAAKSHDSSLFAACEESVRGPASAMAQNRLAQVRCGAELAGRV